MVEKGERRGREGRRRVSGGGEEGSCLRRELSLSSFGEGRREREGRREKSRKEGKREKGR